MTKTTTTTTIMMISVEFSESSSDPPPPSPNWGSTVVVVVVFVVDPAVVDSCTAEVDAVVTGGSDVVKSPDVVPSLVVAVGPGTDVVEIELVTVLPSVCSVDVLDCEI